MVVICYLWSICDNIITIMILIPGVNKAPPLPVAGNQFAADPGTASKQRSWVSLVQEIYGRRTGPVFGSFMDDLLVHAGFETQTVRPYYWDARKRGADENHPFIVFQYTLDGWGIFEDSDGPHRMEPGMAFSTRVPSEDVYHLPERSNSWTFFWIILQHPYVVERIMSVRENQGGVVSFGMNDPLMLRMLHIFEGLCTDSFPDRWSLEQSLFEFLFEYEKLAQRLKYPSDRRDELMHKVKAFVAEHPGRLVIVEEIADAFGMSRSHFSHKFKQQTGLAPAQFIRRISFDEATRRLLETDDKLETIALSTGFANANHFCKFFRKRYHLSPGSFRRQMKRPG